MSLTPEQRQAIRDDVATWPPLTEEQRDALTLALARIPAVERSTERIQPAA